jgi:hypothetical protein
VFRTALLPPSSRGLLGCDAMQCCGRIPTFRRSMLPPSSSFHYTNSHHTEEDAARFFETLVSYHLITRRHDPEDFDMNLRCHENLKSRVVVKLTVTHGH